MPDDPGTLSDRSGGRPLPPPVRARTDTLDTVLEADLRAAAARLRRVWARQQRALGDPRASPPPASILALFR